MPNRWGNSRNSETIFLGSKITADGDCSHEIKRCLLLWRKVMTNLHSILKAETFFATKICLVKAMFFPVFMYRCENWTRKKTEHQRIGAFELWCPLDCKEIKPVSPKENQSWIFLGRTYAETEAPIPWPIDAKKWHFGRDSDAEKDWRQEKKGISEDEMVGWHHWLDGHKFMQALGFGDEQGNLAFCSPWGCKESDTVKWLNGIEGPNFHISQLVLVQAILYRKMKVKCF